MSETGPGTRTVFFADWHLPPQRTAQTEFFLRFVSEACAGAGRVFVLGDLFAAWVGPRHAAAPGHAATLDALAELARGGSNVTLLRGNRDFLLDAKTARRYGLALAPKGWRGELDGHRAWLVHGDGLSENDRMHKTLRALTGNFPVSTVVKAMPLGASDALAGAYRWLSDRRHARRERKRLGPDARRLAREFLGGTDLIVLGHWHEPMLEQAALGMPGKTLVRLGECTDRLASYAELDDGIIVLKQFTA